jgi:hypothetical protein
VTSMTGKGGVVTAIPTLSGGAIAGLVIMCVVVTTLIVGLGVYAYSTGARTRLVLQVQPARHHVRRCHQGSTSSHSTGARQRPAGSTPIAATVGSRRSCHDHAVERPRVARARDCAASTYAGRSDSLKTTSRILRGRGTRTQNVERGRRTQNAERRTQNAERRRRTQTQTQTCTRTQTRLRTLAAQPGDRPWLPVGTGTGSKGGEHVELPLACLLLILSNENHLLKSFTQWRPFGRHPSAGENSTRCPLIGPHAVRTGYGICRMATD